MPWSVTQQKRLGFEKGLLEKYFGNRVTWIDPGDRTKVEVQVTSSSDEQYTLIMKGLIWLEAYEAHLRTGQPLSQYLGEMRK